MKSIFLEPQYETKFTITSTREYEPFLYPRHIKTISSINEFKNNKEIYVCDINKPTLKENEIFYLSYINKYVTIKSIIRSSDNNEIFYIVENNYYITEEENKHKLELEKELMEVEEIKKQLDNKTEEINKINKNINALKEYVNTKIFIFANTIKKYL